MDDTDKIWFIWIDGQREGPKSYDDLKNDPRLTPDTWIWKKGFENWKKIRDVKALEDLFKEDSPNAGNDEIPSTNDDPEKGMQDELVIDMGQEPPYFLWILLALICLIYVIIQLYR